MFIHMWISYQHVDNYVDKYVDNFNNQKIEHLFELFKNTKYFQIFCLNNTIPLVISQTRLYFFKNINLYYCIKCLIQFSYIEHVFVFWTESNECSKKVSFLYIWQNPHAIPMNIWTYEHVFIYQKKKNICFLVHQNINGIK